jgi:UrcA family protein
MKNAKALSIGAAVLVTAGGASVITSPASARTQRLVVTAPADTVSRHIGFADLNLVSPQGERALVRRVEYGVNDMCLDGSGGRDGSFDSKTYLVRCTGAAWDQARPQIANAVQRARDLAATGSSSIAATALTITLPK